MSTEVWYVGITGQHQAPLGGTIVCKDLAPGETLRLAAGCLVAVEPRVNDDLQWVGGFKTAGLGRGDEGSVIGGIGQGS